jgi:hypothetical protein
MSNEVKLDSEKIKRWYNMSEQLKKLKEDEMNLRKEIVKDLLGTPTARTTGKYNSDGMMVKAVYEIETKIDDKDTLMEDYDGLPPEIQACFPLKPDFSKTAYKKLDDEGKKVVDGYLVDSPAAPTLEVKLVEA